VNVDEFGERLSIDTHNYARIISREGLLLDDDIEVEEEEEEVIDEDGNVIKKRKKAPVIPVPDLYNVNYFQLRLDDVKPPRILVPSGEGEGARGEMEITDDEAEPIVTPRIVIGVCRSTL